MDVLIVHHTDADGHCAAAVARYELTNDFDSVSYYAYNYFGDIKTDVANGTQIYLVDISMNDNVEEFIKTSLEKGCRVVHIDHHKTSVEYYNEHDIDNPNWIYLVHDENDDRGPVSGCLLTFVYASMNSSQKQTPMDVNYDFTELRDHFRLDPKDADDRYVPYIVRLVDDHDVWRHKLNESKAFSYAYKRLPKEVTDPECDDLWEAIYNEHHIMIRQMMLDGERILADEKARNEILLEIGGFETDIFGNSCICLNNLTAGSDQFGDKYDEYDMVCRFAYNGNGWSYSLYSSKKETDCSEIAKRYGGGGHTGAAGFKLDYCIFGGEKPVEKKGILSRIKHFFFG